MIPSQYLADLTHLAEDIESPYPFVYLDFSRSESSVAHFGVKRDNLPYIVLFDAHEDRWTPYDGILTDANVQHWISGLDLEKLKWKGPHQSLKESVFHSFIDQSSFLSYAVIGLLSYGGFLWWKQRKMLRPRNRRPSDFAFTPL
jgi:hypothetical protein